MNARLPVITLFFGSFLLFCVQPLLGRTLLPAFGGSAAVWSVCLATFQLLLLVGYCYAHVLGRKSIRVQRTIHLVLLALAVLWTAGFAALRPLFKAWMGNSGTPSLEVLFCVLSCAGLPYVLLSSNSILIQAWIAEAGRGVYRLYAVSNLGSLLGLFAYPFLMEPLIPLNVQWFGFTLCLLLYTVLVSRVAASAAARYAVKAAGQETRSAACHFEPPASSLPAPLMRPWLWVVLPFLGTFLLNAVTLHLSAEVTPVPMMWVLLLTVYLLSFILGFSSIGEKGLIIWAGLSVLILACASWSRGVGTGSAFLTTLALGAGTVLVCCTCLHSWLYRIRPDAVHLTRFYLAIAAGGALGGTAASLLAPVCFTAVSEFPLALMIMLCACAWLIRTWNHPEMKGLNSVLLFLSLASAVLITTGVLKSRRGDVLRLRNFYGCLRVTSETVKRHLEQTYTLYKFQHGETLHGIQVRDPVLGKEPTTYYGPQAGGAAIRFHPKFVSGVPMRIGGIGLGIGTLACYGRTNDLYRFYEINPQVVQVASNTNLFTYLSGSAAAVEVVLGDARKRLEAEVIAGAPRYDVLVVDAYSGDSIPFHLATQEAFALYLERLLPDGILAVHASNWHIDLLPLCKAVAKEFDLKTTGLISLDAGLVCGADWVFLSRVEQIPDVAGTRKVDWEKIRAVRLPSDEQGSLLSLLCLGRSAPLKTIHVDLDRLFTSPAGLPTRLTSP